MYASGVGSGWFRFGVRSGYNIGRNITPAAFTHKGSGGPGVERGSGKGNIYDRQIQNDKFWLQPELLFWACKQYVSGGSGLI